jgi:cytochrome c553
MTVVVLLSLSSGPAQARDAEAGRAKSQMCAVCHGVQGIATAPDAPHLAGQPAIYTALQMQAYRSGARKHEVMSVIARMLTDDDISNLAAWYASLRIEIQTPR